MATSRITMQRIAEPFYFEAKNAAGNTVAIDAGEAIGGTGKGARPMELMLMGLAGCSGIDVVNILRKQRQEIKTINVSVEGDRSEGKDANLYTHIRVHYDLVGTIDEDSLKRALALTFDKYCSVAKILEKSAAIAWSYTVNGQSGGESDAQK